MEVENKYIYFLRKENCSHALTEKKITENPVKPIKSQLTDVCDRTEQTCG